MSEIKRLSNKEIASFCNQASMLIAAGITPLDATGIMLNDCKNEEGQRLLKAIIDESKKGETYGSALDKTKAFPSYVINMIKLGESSGNLDVCMRSLSNYYDKEEHIFESVKSAVVYPLIMILMMMVVIFVLVSKVMPIFNQVFEELGTEMTGFAASLLKLGNSLNRYSIIFLVIIVLILAFFLFCTRTGKGRHFASKTLSKFTKAGSFYEAIACERFASGLALCLSAGMDTFESLDIVSTLVGAKAMKVKIEECKKLLLDGASFAEALTNSHIFSNLYSQMIAIGFKSGNSDAILNKIADEYEHEADRRIQNIISILEPTLVIILSIIVGLILLSVILPLMGIMSSIG